MVKFEASGVGVPKSGKYFSGAPSTAADMVARYHDKSRSVGNNYKFIKGDGFSCPTSATKGSVFKKYDRWTSPYYVHKGLCPEGEGIILKEDCKQAGDLFSGGDMEEQTRDANPGCTRKYGDGGVVWNPNLKAKRMSNVYPLSMCKRLPKDMHDFAALQADGDKMTFHCLNGAKSFADFRQCMLEMKRWNLDRAWTKADMEAQRKAANQLEEEKAQEQKKEENKCWRKHNNKVAGREASGFEVWAGTLIDTKIKCARMGDKCTAVSCYKQGKIGGGEEDRCMVKGPNDQMKNTIPNRKYATYTRC